MKSIPYNKLKKGETVLWYKYDGEVLHDPIPYTINDKDTLAGTVHLISELNFNSTMLDNIILEEDDCNEENPFFGYLRYPL